MSFFLTLIPGTESKPPMYRNTGMTEKKTWFGDVLLYYKFTHHEADDDVSLNLLL